MSALKKGFFKATQKVDIALKGSKKYYDDEYNDLDEKFEMTRKNLVELSSVIEDYLEPRKSSKVRFSSNHRQSQNKEGKHLPMETKVADSLSKCSSELDGYLGKAFNQLFDMFCRISSAKESLESTYMEKIKSDMSTRVIANSEEIKNVGKKVDSKGIKAQATKLDKKATEESIQAAQDAFNTIKLQRQGMLTNFVENSEPEYVLYITNFVNGLEQYFDQCHSITKEFSSILKKTQEQVNKKEKVTVNVMTQSQMEIPSATSNPFMNTPATMTGQGSNNNPFEQASATTSQQQGWGSSHAVDNSGWGAPPAAQQVSNSGWSNKTDTYQTSAHQMQESSYNPFEVNTNQTNQMATQNQSANNYNPFESQQTSQPAASTGLKTAPKEVTARVVFDFTAENSDELNVRAGDIVTIVERVDENWYVARSGGMTGYVPKDFIEINE